MDSGTYRLIYTHRQREGLREVWILVDQFLFKKALWGRSGEEGGKTCRRGGNSHDSYLTRCSWYTVVSGYIRLSVSSLVVEAIVLSKLLSDGVTPQLRLFGLPSTPDYPQLLIILNFRPPFLKKYPLLLCSSLLPWGAMRSSNEFRYIQADLHAQSEREKRPYGPKKEQTSTTYQQPHEDLARVGKQTPRVNNAGSDSIIAHSPTPQNLSQVGK